MPIITLTTGSLSDPQPLLLSLDGFGAEPCAPPPFIEPATHPEFGNRPSSSAANALMSEKCPLQRGSPRGNEEQQALHVASMAARAQWLTIRDGVLEHLQDAWDKAMVPVIEAACEHHESKYFRQSAVWKDSRYVQVGEPLEDTAWRVHESIEEIEALIAEAS